MRVTIIKIDKTNKESVFYFDLVEKQSSSKAEKQRKKNPKESEELEFFTLNLLEVSQPRHNYQDADSPVEVKLNSLTSISDLNVDTRPFPINLVGDQVSDSDS